MGSHPSGQAGGAPEVPSALKKSHKYFLGLVDNHDILIFDNSLIKTSLFSFLAKTAKGGVNIRNIKAFRQD